MDELFVVGSHEERPDDIGVGHIGQLGALSGEAPNVLTESFIRLLVVAPEIPRVTRAYISTLEVPLENLYEVGPVVDATGQKMF
jgi:hypothetical protein